MARQLTADDARQSLSDHAAERGAEVRELFGEIGWTELQRILNDRTICRYPCEIVFEAGALQEGEAVFPEPKGGLPEDGFTMFVHPIFQAQLDKVPILVLYQLVAVNYGDFASPDDAETFGANALGLTKEQYYQALCDLTDAVPI